jgi:AraC family transcriptional regulator
LAVERLAADVGDRGRILVWHEPAVERVILAMRERLDETLSLETMAEIAALSPYHFNRVFRQITGVPPGEFLTALRLAAAKRLLLTTPLSVTDVCFEVGYSSVGSFTTRFTQSVGLPPLRLRRLAAEPVRSLQPIPDSASSCAGGVGIHGEVTVPGAFAGVIHVGAFPSRLPQSRPVGCTRLFGPGAYHIGALPDGWYHVLSAAYPRSRDSLTYLVPEHGVYVGGSERPVLVQGGRACEPVNVALRRPRVTDPPIVTATPFVSRLDASTSVASPRATFR